MISGAFIGAGISRDDLKNLKRLIKPLAILVSCMFALNIIMGFVLYNISDIDLYTAMFCAVPGGISNTTIIAAEAGADTGKVALMQFMRLCAGVGVFPSLIAYMGRDEENEEGAEQDMKRSKTAYNIKGFLIVFMAAIAGGILGDISNIPAGTLLFALIGAIIAKQIYPKCMMPRKIKIFAQMLSGAYIATSINPAEVSELKSFLLPGLVLVGGYFVSCILVGKLIHKKCNMTLKESMLTATPAGASDMALIAADIGVNSPDVVVLQIGRMLFAILVFPMLSYNIADIYLRFFA